MHQSVFLTVRTAVVAGSIAALTACAQNYVTPQQLSAVESKISSAVTEARSAGKKADDAMKLAQSASEAASQAQSAAQAAMSCCNENKDRIDKMFEEAMRK